MKKHQGYSLLEFSFALAVILVIGMLVASAGAFYRDSARNAELRNHLLAVKAGASALTARGGQSGFADHASVARAGGVSAESLVPAAAVGAGGGPADRAAALAAAGSRVLRHPFGGLTGVRFPVTAGPGGRLLPEIILFDLTSDQCVAAVGLAWDAFHRITVNDSTPMKDLFAAPQIAIADSAAIEADCTLRTTNAVRYEFAP